MAGSWLFECFATSSFDTIETNTSDEGASTPGAQADQDDRGFRKKSREKMRRHEVNVKVRRLEPNLLSEWLAMDSSWSLS